MIMKLYMAILMMLLLVGSVFGATMTVGTSSTDQPQLYDGTASDGTVTDGANTDGANGVHPARAAALRKAVKHTIKAKPAELKSNIDACMAECASDDVDCAKRCRHQQTSAFSIQAVKSHKETHEERCTAQCEEDEDCNTRCLAHVRKMFTEDASGKIKVNKEHFLKQREVTREMYQKAKEAYTNAKERRKEFKEKAQEARGELKAAKEKLRECYDANGDDSTECAAVADEIFQHAKEYVVGTAKEGIEHLESLKAKAEESEDLDGETASEITTRLDDLIAELTALAEKADAATTKEELHEAASEIKDMLVKMRRHANVHAKRIVKAAAYGLKKRTEYVGIKLEELINRLAVASIDTTELESLLDEYNEYLGNAEEAFAAADELFKEARELAENGEENSETLKKAHEYIKEADQHVKNARNIADKIFAAVRSHGANLKDTDDVEEMVVDVVDADATTVAGVDGTATDGVMNNE